MHFCGLCDMGVIFRLCGVDMATLTLCGCGVR